MNPRRKFEGKPLSRRTLLQGMGLAPLLLRPAPFRAAGLLFPPFTAHALPEFADVRFSPHSVPSPLADVLARVAPGSDEFLTEQDAVEIEALFRRWAGALKASPRDDAPFAALLHPDIEGCILARAEETPLRTGFGIDAVRRRFPSAPARGIESFRIELRAWLESFVTIEVAEFEIYGIAVIASAPRGVEIEMRYDIAGTRSDNGREERVGSWKSQWRRSESSGNTAAAWKAVRWKAGEETASIVRGPGFVDITGNVFGGVASYREQLLRGVDHWRTVLDGAIGVDVYSNNGIAAGDFDNDGFDDLYICQPAGLPNRLYRNRGDGTFEDVTEGAGVAVLDNTACALFADFDNRGLQDLLVVCGTGPLLFRNRGDGKFELKRDAFQFARPPQGTFTHAALTDYDRDGRLDIYFCLYMYYLGLDQYHYPIPYYDARNGPPNCLFHNQGDGVFVERTAEAGLDADNDRYSFACAFGDSRDSGLPDLFVANDFGSSQLFRNNGDGTFKVASREANVEDVGAGMSCCWADTMNSGHQDVYVPSMWEAAGQRISRQPIFHAQAPENVRVLYQRHARGNALYRNKGNGAFQNVGEQAGVAMGRWSWCSDFFDFDHDGFPDLYVANGYISAERADDLAGFFWRQVVAKSPEDATPAPAYERGWSAINELIRSDSTWHGYARNVLFVNNRDGTFSEASAPAGMDFLEDSRSFALADLDHDGRLEVILKNRNAPQLRILRNAMPEIGRSISFRLRGTKSNRDAVGASVTLEAGPLRQTKYVQAGSGFLAQHTRELFFGLGSFAGAARATVRWPSGLLERFDDLPSGHRIDIVEAAAKFSAAPFIAPPSAWTKPQVSSSTQPLPQNVETWLIQPLPAPEFSLPDLAGAQRSIREWRGKPLLLAFWSTAAPASLDQLRRIESSRSALAAAGIEIAAVSLDGAATASAARSFASKNRLAFPVLFADEEAAGVYNLVYRYLFDRRRNLPIPSAFLLDRDGMIVKVFQGELNPKSIAGAARSIPATTPERTARALPFRGTAFNTTFQRNDFTYGVAFAQHGYLNQAAESFRQVLAAHPDDPDGYYNLGTLSLERGRLDDARSHLEKAVQLRPAYPEAWNNLGMIAAQQSRLDEAVAAFQRAIAQRPAYSIALLNLGNVYRRRRDYRNAEDSFRRAIAIEPANAEISYSLGMLFAQQNQLDAAAEYLQKAIALRPGYPEAMNNLGVLYVRRQDNARAEDQFRTAIRLAPGYDQSYLNLARLYAIENDKNKARAVLRDFLSIQPENAAAKQALEALQ